MEENREKIESLKRSFSISRMEEVNPHPFQLYQMDPVLGRKQPAVGTSEKPLYSWLDELKAAVRRNIKEVLAG